MTLLADATRNERSSLENKIVFSTYRWFNRLAWPFEAVLSGFVAYWSLFELPNASWTTHAGGLVFAVFAGVCAVSSLMWWVDDKRNSLYAEPADAPRTCMPTKAEAESPGIGRRGSDQTTDLFRAPR
jgi:hypothetical protein